MVSKFKALAVVSLLGASLMMSGCSATARAGGDEISGKLMVAPLLPDYKQEVTLAKLNEVLSTMELTEEQRARFHYERGVLYDSLGLRLLGRLDFSQALRIRPDIADAYNFLGIYYTQEGEFDSAYEAFDGVLELQPDYDYAYLNRGIALYYGERADLAIADMNRFFSLDPSDGYRSLWLYLVESAKDKPQALAHLKQHRQQLSGDAWATVLVDFYLGKVNKSEVFAKAKQGLSQPREYTERLCEAYFYLAKTEAEQGNKELAANYLRLALATNVYDFVEHRYARVELARLAGQE
ncbi:lipoprotein NlpI [Shewanella cyperi]|uniref:Lipoprotein NlpI n=1 Tax=Shewanella cyperi TaxID=2814292 RepID=A0A975ALY6_9GAMM|nr:lipoprotein NlpI [Shewanella cyperi]QSX30902.1 lipoprotein NlpI [Shewanella cyperi]QSX41681.1 lipoprotein NlpI [Shewanella cyperi]